MKLRTIIVFLIAVTIAIGISGYLYVEQRRYPAVGDEGYAERIILLKVTPTEADQTQGISTRLRNYIRRNDPYISFYPADSNTTSPAMIVVPGGAYSGRAEMEEGVATAKWLNSMGISAFVLHYRVSPYRYPAQLNDLKEAMRYVRQHAKELHIDPRRTGVIGYSAGGHLAANLITLNNEPELRPDIAVLCYPVITMGEQYTHQPTKRNLLGDQLSEDLVTLLSAEKQVRRGMPPVFVWTTKADQHVPVQNSELFVQALEDKGVPHEYHLFDDGWHGMGLAEGVKQAGNWPVMLHCWLECMSFLSTPADSL